MANTMRRPSQGKVLAFNIGRMALNTWDNGIETRRTGMVGSF